MMQVLIEGSVIAGLAMLLGVAATFGTAEARWRRAAAVASVLLVVVALPLRGLVGLSSEVGWTVERPSWAAPSAGPWGRPQVERERSLAPGPGSPATTRRETSASHPAGGAPEGALVPESGSVPELARVPSPSFAILGREPLESALLAFWALGVVVVLLRGRRSLAELRRMLSRTRPATPDQQAWLDAHAVDGGAARLCVADNGIAPFCTRRGGESLVVVPASLLDAELDRVQDVLAHECAHLRHRDDWIGRLQWLSRAQFWFLPGVRAWSRRVDLTLEQAADEAVLRSGRDPLAYARTLLAVAGERPAPGAPGLGGPEPGLSRRVRRLVAPAPARSGRLSPALSALASLALGLVAASCKLAAVPDSEPHRPEAEPVVLRTLYLETSPRWDYRYLKNEFLRDPLTPCHCFLLSAEEDFAQERSEGLSSLRELPAIASWNEQWDLVVLGAITPEQIAAARGGEAETVVDDLDSFVRAGGRLLLFGHESERCWRRLLASEKVGTTAETDRFAPERAELGASDFPEHGVRFDEGAIVAPGDGVEVLARSEAHAPMVLRRSLDRGVVLGLPFSGVWRWRSAPRSGSLYTAFWRGIVDELRRRGPGGAP